MTPIHTQLLLAKIDVPVRVIKIKRGLTIRGNTLIRPCVVLDLADEVVTLCEGDTAVINASGKYENNR